MSGEKKNTQGVASSVQLNPNECMRTHEVARKLGVSQEHVKRLLRKKLLPGFRLGRMWLVRRSELDRYLRALTAEVMKCSDSQLNDTQRN